MLSRRERDILKDLVNNEGKWTEIQLARLQEVSDEEDNDWIMDAIDDLKDEDYIVSKNMKVWLTTKGRRAAWQS